MEIDPMRTERNQPESDGIGIGTAVTFLLIGLGAGALVGMMYATKPGKQFRKDLRRKIDDAKDTLDDWKDQAMEVAEEAMDRGSDLTDDLRERVAPLAKNLRRR
jgi:gas vesicle protein